MNTQHSHDSAVRTHARRSTPARSRTRRVGLGLGLAVAGSLALSTVAGPALASPTAPSAVPSSSSAAAAAGGGLGSYQLTARVAALYLTQLDPSGKAVGGYSGQQSDGSVYASYKLDRGKGPVQVDVNVQQPNFTPEDIAAVYSCDSTAYLTCDVKPDTDGSYLKRATEKLPKGGVAVTVDLLRGDGTRVVVLSGNTADSKYGGKVHGAGITTKTATSIVYSEKWVLDQPAPAADVAKAKKVIRPWTLLA